MVDFYLDHWDWYLANDDNHGNHGEQFQFVTMVGLDDTTAYNYWDNLRNIKQKENRK